MALVESFVRFARDVGATVCAEGIESLEELAVIADLDVQWGQGYALARPGEPWGGVSQEAAELCRLSLAETFRSMPAERHPVGASDRRLVHLSARLAGARTRDDLESALALIAAELGASQVALSAWLSDADALETLAETGDPAGQRLFAIDEYPLSARVLDEQEAVQVVVGDPDSDPSEVELLLALGERSLLMVPVVCRGESLGLIEAYRSDERAWTRAEINRARVDANQIASVIPTLTGESGSARAPAFRASAERETRA
jgi:GAF domain-containing protein